MWKATNFERLSRWPWIGAPPRSHVYKLLRELFDTQGLTPNLVVESDEVSALGSLVRAGLGLSLLREDLALQAAERGELVIWGHARVDTQLQFIYRATDEHDPAVVGMVSVLRAAWGLIGQGAASE